jgi:hypothetical protein
MEPSDLAPCLEHQALLQQLTDAGYQVLEMRPSDRGLVWTLMPQQSHVEFQLVGSDEVRRFLDHH